MQGSGTTLFTVRGARAEDAEALATLSEQLGYPVSTAQIRRRLEQVAKEPAHAVLVASDREGNLLGWTHVCVRPLIIADLQAEIEGLVVDKDHRRHGVGRSLLNAAEHWAWEQGCNVVQLRSNVLRDEAHDFYPALGYQHFKTQRAYRKDL